MRNMKGFSLIELLVVVAIIGVLAAAGVVGYQNYTETAKENVAKNNYGNVVRYVRTQAGIAATKIEDVDECGSSNIAACHASTGASSATGVPAFLVTYFDDQGFENPFDNQDAVFASSTAPTCSGNTRGVINLDVASGSSNVVIRGCEGSGLATQASASIPWAD